jgi:hypothetical protein
MPRARRNSGSRSKILRRDRESGSRPPSTHTAEAFANFFHRKMKDIRSSTDGYPTAATYVPAMTKFYEFREYSLSDVRRVIMAPPTKSCILDPVPTFLLKESVEALLPFLTVMINRSLNQGCLPASQKHAVVCPLLKKSTLDATELKNYRPVSNLSFTSKLVERIVSEQLVQYLNENSLMPRLQSAYRRHHSKETKQLQALSDIFAATDKQCVTLLGLLDLSAALRRSRNPAAEVGIRTRWLCARLADLIFGSPYTTGLL